MLLSAIYESADIANVGVSINPNSIEHKRWSRNNRFHLQLVHNWLKNNSTYTLCNKRHDYIDLSDGRDFLQENQKYDIVILHMINANDGLRSSIHNKENWRNRLSFTGAKYIFCFGNGLEVNHKYLRFINNYNLLSDEGYFQVYIREAELNK